MQPDVIIFDEPTAGLDPRGRRELLDLIQSLKQHKHSSTDSNTIIYASSSLEEVIELADDIYILDQGHVVMHGTPREILAQAIDLIALDIALPEATHIALSLRDIFPTIRTDVLSMTELEDEILKNMVEVKR
jgi:energy-coupling factor transport system ATP-binding protein